MSVPPMAGAADAASPSLSAEERAKDALYGHAAFTGGTLAAIESQIRAAEAVAYARGQADEAAKWHLDPPRAADAPSLSAEERAAELFTAVGRTLTPAAAHHDKQVIATALRAAEAARDAAWVGRVREAEAGLLAHAAPTVPTDAVRDWLTFILAAAQTENR